MAVIACVTDWELIVQTSTNTIPNIEFTYCVIKTATTMQTPVSVLIFTVATKSDHVKYKHDHKSISFAVTNLYSNKKCFTATFNTKITNNSLKKIGKTPK